MKISSNVEGFISTIEGSVIEHLSSKCSKGCIVQIGCFKGRSSWYIINGKQPHIDAYLIDIDLQPEMKTLKCDTIHVIEANSQVESTLQGIPPIEFLFIDGDHSYEGVKRDILMWYDKVVPGGVIVFHDAYPDNNFDVWPGVLQAIIHYVINPKYGELKTDGFLFNSPIHRIDTMFMIQKIV